MVAPLENTNIISSHIPNALDISFVCKFNVLSNLFNVPAIAVDTHVSRVSKRLGLAKNNDDVLTIEKKLQKKFDKSLWAKRHLQMVLFGRYYCKSINPKCETCKLKNICKKELLD